MKRKTQTALTRWVRQSARDRWVGVHFTKKHAYLTDGFALARMPAEDAPAVREILATAKIPLPPEMDRARWTGGEGWTTPGPDCEAILRSATGKGEPKPMTPTDYAQFVWSTPGKVARIYHVEGGKPVAVSEYYAKLAEEISGAKFGDWYAHPIYSDGTPLCRQASADLWVMPVRLDAPADLRAIATELEAK